YAGTADQNNKLLNLLMSGKLKRVGSSGGGNPGVLYFPTPSYTGTSLVGALNAIGVDSSFDNREKIAAANGITDYAGTADQNNKLLNLLMSGRLIRPASAGEDGSGDSGTGSSGIDGVPNLKVREILPPESKYSIKCPYPMDPTYITVHNTYNQASAYNEITFMHNNNDEVSYHFAVDDQEAIQGLPLNRNGWHSGDGGQGTGNRKSIAVEICYSKYGGEKFDKAEKNAAKLIASLMDKFNIPIDRIRKHQDWSGKYCPHRTLDAGWDRFVDMIMTEVRYQQILKFASENGLFEGYDVDFKGFNHKEKLFEIPGTIPWRPHVIVYGEVSLVPKITNIFDVKKVLDLALTPEQMADELLDITLTQEKVEVNISREGLVLTLSNMNLGALNCDEITLTFNLDNGVFNIIAEVAETKVFENLETTVYQQLTITVHPDIQQPGLLHVPIRNTEPLKDTAEENVDYITTTAKRHRAASAVTYALIFASCLAGAAGGGWVPATVLTAFALIVKSDK
ncbi:N-acetylmuramoyl-L-alanine amidase family protein, partial [Turicibacter sanguinis]